MKQLLALALLLVASPAWADDEHPFAGFSAVTPSATSKLDGEHGAGDGFGDSAVGWCAKKGTGVGDSITFTFGAATEIGSLTIDTTPVRKANKVTKLTVAIDGAAATTVAVDKKGRATVTIGASVTTIQIGIAAAKKGKKRASCLRAWTGGAFAIVSDPAAATALATDGPKIVAALESCDAATLDAAFAFPFVATSHTDGEDDEETTTYRDAKDLAARHCESASLEYADCSAGDLDTMVCEVPGTGGDQTWWTIAWKAGDWKATGVDRTIGTGE